MRRKGEAVEQIGDLAGLSRSSQPLLAYALRRLPVLDGRHPALRRLLRQAVRLQRRDPGRHSMSLAVIGVVASVVSGLLLHPRHQGDVLRPAGRGVFDRPDPTLRVVLLVCAVFVVSSASSCPARVADARDQRRGEPVLAG